MNDREGAASGPDGVLAAFAAALGSDRVLADAATLDRQQRNLTEYPKRRYRGVLRPVDRDGVIAALAVASDNGVPLFPFSSGRNWGLGSRLPTVDDGFLLDLSGLDKVRTIDVEHRYAVVEPGVNQRALADAVAATGADLMVHLTGAPEETSIVGNCLDRGVGYFGGRIAGVRGLEVVLANGRILRTGHWRFGERSDGEALAHCYPLGLGPDLTGLFCQSNLGIVTALVFDLIPKRPFVAVMMRFVEEDMTAVIGGLAELRRQNVISEGYEIDNDPDPRVSGLGLDRGTEAREWVVWMHLPGSPRQIATAKHHILRRLGSHCARIDFIDPEDPEATGRDPYFAALCERWNGEPGNFSLVAMARASGVETDGAGFNPDREPAVRGFVCALPALPLNGADIGEVLAVVERVSETHGVTAALTMSGLSTLAMEGFFRVYFDRSDADAVARAQDWNADLHARLSAIGVHPYRLNVAQMPDYFGGDGISGGDVYLDTLRNIKTALDPLGIIAPGRYGPSGDGQASPKGGRSNE